MNKNYLLGIYMVLGTLLDFFTTLYFTSFDYILESNPIVRVLLGYSPAYFFLFKFVTIGFIMSVFYIKKRDVEWAFQMTAYICGTLWMGAGLWNFYLFYL